MAKSNEDKMPDKNLGNPRGAIDKAKGKQTAWLIYMARHLLGYHHNLYTDF